jgi:phosphomannomutase
VAHEETLTGFKWIARVPGLAFGYEEALGYCVAPEVVRDKDGVSAALLVAEQAAGLAAAGRSLLDVLDDLAVEHGVYATDAFSVRVSDFGADAGDDGAAALSAPNSGGWRGGGSVGRLGSGGWGAAADRRVAVLPG